MAKKKSFSEDPTAQLLLEVFSSRGGCATEQKKQDYFIFGGSARQAV
jgi:hypothetical protein